MPTKAITNEKTATPMPARMGVRKVPTKGRLVPTMDVPMKPQSTEMPASGAT